jgi:hypothetical protein
MSKTTVSCVLVLLLGLGSQAVGAWITLDYCYSTGGQGQATITGSGICGGGDIATYGVVKFTCSRTGESNTVTVDGGTSWYADNFPLSSGNTFSCWAILSYMDTSGVGRAVATPDPNPQVTT